MSKKQPRQGKVGRWMVFREHSFTLKAEGISQVQIYNCATDTVSPAQGCTQCTRAVPSFGYFNLYKRLQTSGWMALKKPESKAVVEK